MAARLQFQNVREIDPAVSKLLDSRRGVVATEQELAEQRVSFAYGNALKSDRITKDSVRKASLTVRLISSGS